MALFKCNCKSPEECLYKLTDEEKKEMKSPPVLVPLSPERLAIRLSWAKKEAGHIMQGATPGVRKMFEEFPPWACYTNKQEIKHEADPQFDLPEDVFPPGRLTYRIRKVYHDEKADTWGLILWAPRKGMTSGQVYCANPREELVFMNYWEPEQMIEFPLIGEPERYLDPIGAYRPAATGKHRVKMTIAPPIPTRVTSLEDRKRIAETIIALAKDVHEAEQGMTEMNISPKVEEIKEK